MTDNSDDSFANRNPFGLLMLDDNFVITEIDGRFMSIFECLEQDLVGVSLETLFNTKNSKAITDFHRKISSYQTGVIELAIELKINTNAYYVLMRLTKQSSQWLTWIENLHGQHAGLIGQLFCTQDRYKSVVKNSGDGIVMLNQYDELIEFNKSFFDILAIHNKEGILLNEAALIGRNFFDLAGNAFISAKNKIDIAHKNKRAQLHHPVEFQNYSLSLDITPIFQPAIGYIGCGLVIHDQTAHFKLEKRAQELAATEIRLVKEKEAERRELEFQLRQAQKMEAIGQLTGGIAHDFNNILTSVLGNAELGLEVANQNAEPLLQKYMTNLISSAERARDLIGQMLVFSRGQRGDFKVLPLTRVVHDVVKLMELSLPSSVQIHIQIDALGGLVNHDALQIEQVIMNLCMNAHDAMDGAGHIDISLGNSQLANEVCSACGHQFSGDFVALSIHDSGSGIEQATLERMFEPFFSTKEVGKGTGMGLAMAHGIVHEHDGHILVESEKGCGATFKLMFPIASYPSESSLQQHAQTKTTGNIQHLSGSILLVDDEPLVTEFMQDFLQSRGLNVTATNQSSDALEMFQSKPQFFDLVITDHTMPEMTGIQLAYELLQIKPDIPIILYTGHSEKLSEQQVFQQGIKGYLKKPVDTKLLIETVRQLLALSNAS